MTEAAIGLGSNLGDRRLNLETALRELQKTGGIDLTSISSIYETAPWGETDQPAFLNACALLETELTPQLLLERCLAIEAGMGRIRARRWGPRLIDLDVLLHGVSNVKTSTLTLPHPEIQNRAFVLAPLAELAPDFILAGSTIVEHLAHTNLEGVVRIPVALELAS
ncbi:MAG: 2-amino-4-hydroxy-6-hydroxymethyldihydropteridine diphosphokinase [Pseudomonadota bacterium]